MEVLLRGRGPGHDDQFGAASAPVGLAGCYDGWRAAVHAEIGATDAILAAGFDVDVLMTAYHGLGGNGRPEQRIPPYGAGCDATENGDVLRNGKYYGTNVHPYETIFIKANRDIDPVLLRRLTEWHNNLDPTSRDACPRASSSS
jgi:hypothetical protein